jgi:hypothetical protein
VREIERKRDIVIQKERESEREREKQRIDRETERERILHRQHLFAFDFLETSQLKYELAVS